MDAKFLFLAVFLAGSASSDVYYRQPSSAGLYPGGYYRPFPRQYRGYAPVWMSGAYGGIGKGYSVRDESDGEYYSGDVGRKTAHEAEGSGVKAESGLRGSHAVSADGRGSEDYAGRTSGGGLQAAGGAVSGKAKEYGAARNEAHDGFGDAGFKRGRSESGFQKSYSKEESGKDSKFVDEDLKAGGESFVKVYGEELRHSGKEGYGDALKGYGYDHAATSSGAAKSELDSTGKHDVFYGEHAHKGGYDSRDSFIGAEDEGRYHDSNQNTKKAHESKGHKKSMQDKPIN